jgi:hypothetical protein
MTPADMLACAIVCTPVTILLILVVADCLVDCARAAAARARAADDDRPADVPPELLGWPTDITLDDQPATLAPIQPDETRWRTDAEWCVLEDLFACDYRAWSASRREPGRRD